MTAIDPKLREWSTPRQWQLLSAAMEHGSDKAAARALKIDANNIYLARKAVLAKAVRQGYSPDHDMVHPVPDGFHLKGTTTLYDGAEKRLQWVKTDIDKERQRELFLAAVEAMTASVPRVKPIKPPTSSTDALMACFPIGDHHLGMLAWDKETGADYDIQISERLLKSAMKHLVDIAPSCEQALIAVLADFLHYDSFKPLTPTSGHLLDADSRFPKMVAAAIRVLRWVIEYALRKFGRVHVIIEIGNHDMSSAIFMMQLLANVYEKEPRITIDTSPMHFHYFQFGKNLIMTHHGHGVKLQDLPILMANDRPKMWGETEHRTCWTGHVHHTQVKDLVGATVESFAILAPEDAYAHQKGYRSKRNMKSIILHRETGEESRHTVSAGMFA